jgi:hypothetical protein
LGLRGDFVELAAVWDRSPWRIRVLLILSGFLATASIASLAEAVAKWKGFILTGVSFYRDYIRDPIASHLSSLGLPHLSADSMDFLTISLLASGAVLRRQWIQYKLVTEIQSSNLWAAGATLAFALSALVSAFLLHDRLPAVDLWLSICMYVFYLFAVAWPPRRAWDLVCAAYLLAPPLLVCVAAAVNLGLR